MNKPNLFMMPWFPRDFLAATRGWPLISRAIYRELLDAQWEQGGLSAEPTELRILIGATPAEWRIGWPQVAPKFPKDADGLRRNQRLEEHRAKAVVIAHRRAESGRKGGNARVANAKQMLGKCSSDAQASTQNNTEDAYEGAASPLPTEYLQGDAVRNFGRVEP
ncbi:MAG: hypothetical protein M0038_06255 [Pseudomonadota bacterium]|jgi:uncharacterized protein YdaU (DUF1376 family)|nr:hypothetical protein [Pseudomonadota bacterium]